MWSSGTGFAGILGFILEIFILKNALDWVRLLVGLIIVGIFLGSFFLLLQAPTNGWPTKETRSTEEIGKMTFIERFRRVLSLWPYIIPLVLVYFAEYAIQAGAWTAYSFDSSQVDNLESRNDAYLWLNLMYQIGVFISRLPTDVDYGSCHSYKLVCYCSFLSMLPNSFGTVGRFFSLHYSSVYLVVEST